MTGAGSPVPQLAPQLAIVYTLYGDREGAETAARAMVEGGLAACANILSPADSVYRWNGLLEMQREYPVLFKTRPTQRDALVAAIRAAHPYEVPAIADWPAGTTSDYARWAAIATGEA